MNPDNLQPNQNPNQQGLPPMPPAPSPPGQVVQNPLMQQPATAFSQMPASPDPLLPQQPAVAPVVAPGTIQSVPGQQAPQPMAPMTPKTRDQANTTQNALQLAEIRDGIVIMNDGSFRSVIMVKSINFDLMSPEEREAVEFSYQGFLNSLYFPVQIFIHSTRVDIRPYLERLDKQRMELDNMLLAMLMEDYIGFIDALAEQSNIMDKQFYVVIPYYAPVTMQMAAKGGKKLFGNLLSAFAQNKSKPVVTIDEGILEKAKIELKNRVESVSSALLQAGIQSIALDTKELSELFYNVYNPDTATRQQLIDIAQLNATVIQKGQGQAQNPNLDIGTQQ